MTRERLVSIFFGDDESKYPLPTDLLYLILETAGLAKYGRHMSMFALYFTKPLFRGQNATQKRQKKKTKGFRMGQARDENVSRE